LHTKNHQIEEEPPERRKDRRNEIVKDLEQVSMIDCWVGAESVEFILYDF
jgi:hypothetical protein